MSTIIQRESDIQFLKRLARRNGFECVMRGQDGVFGKPDLDDAVAARPGGPLRPGDQPDARSTRTGTRCGRRAVECTRSTPLTKQVQTATSPKSEQKPLGKDGAVAPPLARGGSRHVRAAHRHHRTARSAEPRQALADEAEWFIEVKGEVDTAPYGAILHARRQLPIKGVGELLSGLYYLTSVRAPVHGRPLHRSSSRRGATRRPASLRLRWKSPLPFCGTSLAGTQEGRGG